MAEVYSKLMLLCVLAVGVYKVLDVWVEGIRTSTKDGDSSQYIRHAIITNQPVPTPRCPQCNVFDLSKSNNVELECIQMKISPPSPICLYPDEKDIYVSANLKKHGMWEQGYILKFQEYLRKYPESGVIDIGTNIGVYSLVAAAMDKNVLSVEPNRHNIDRFHKAIQLGHFSERVTLLQNAISDHIGVAEIVYHPNNQGMTQVRHNEGVKTGKNEFEDELVFTKMIVMNDLLPFCKFKEAIMKIDIEGFEHRAFVHAELLFDNIKIHKVMMEWDWMRHIDKTSKPDDDALVENMITFLCEREYTPKPPMGNDSLIRDQWQTWPPDVVWHKN